MNDLELAVLKRCNSAEGYYVRGISAGGHIRNLCIRGFVVLDSCYMTYRATDLGKEFLDGENRNKSNR